MLKTNVVKHIYSLVCRTPHGIQTLTVEAESPAAAGEKVLPPGWTLLEVSR